MQAVFAQQVKAGDCEGLAIGLRGLKLSVLLLANS